MLAGYLDTLRAVPSRWKVLIVDQYTQRMLHSVLSTYDVLEEGIQRACRHSLTRSSRQLLAGTELLMRDAVEGALPAYSPLLQRST